MKEYNSKMASTEFISIPVITFPQDKEIDYYDTYDEPLNPKTFPVAQERLNALRLARIGLESGDSITQEVALMRWNQTRNEPSEHFHSVQL